MAGHLSFGVEHGCWGSKSWPLELLGLFCIFYRPRFSTARDRSESNRVIAIRVIDLAIIRFHGKGQQWRQSSHCNQGNLSGNYSSLTCSVDLAYPQQEQEVKTIDSVLWTWLIHSKSKQWRQLIHCDQGTWSGNCVLGLLYGYDLSTAGANSEGN